MDAIAKPTTRPDLVRVQDLEVLYVTVIVSLRFQVHNTTDFQGEIEVLTLSTALTVYAYVNTDLGVL